MTTVDNTQLPKICHACIGQKVRLPDPTTGNLLPEVFVVVALDEPKRRPTRPAMSQGLYDEGRELMLVSLTTGLARKMPHLSSRAELLHADALAAALPGWEYTPVLVTQAPSAWYQVALTLAGGKQLSHATNLVDVADVLALLDRLQTTGARVSGVTEASVHTDEALALWRRDVAAGITQLSFLDYVQEHQL